MSYDENLAQRIRAELKDQQGISEKKMFGGIAFLLMGNMACGVHGEEMIARVGSERHAEAITYEYARPFDITGRPMMGWVLVSKNGLQSDEDFQKWVRWGLDFASALPPK